MIAVLAIVALTFMFADVIVTTVEYKQAEKQLRNLYRDLIQTKIVHTDYRRVIINDPAVIYFDANGDKYVSKAHNEPFDAEKGLLMCIAKSNGFSHNKIAKMLKNADNQKEE